MLNPTGISGETENGKSLTVGHPCQSLSLSPSSWHHSGITGTMAAPHHGLHRRSPRTLAPPWRIKETPATCCSSSPPFPSPAATLTIAAAMPET